MPLRAEYTLHHSDLGDFLGAPIWEEENGNSLSVLSAFARLDIDPWREAERLTSLPKEAAVSALAAIISRLPEQRRTFPETLAIADHLVGLLPRPDAAGAAPEESADGRKANRISNWLIWATLAALLWALVKNGLIF